MNRVLGAAGAAWGILGAAGLLGLAIFRLHRVALEAFVAKPLGPGSWLAALGLMALLGYFMGHRGLARAFAPRVVSRALHLARHPRPLHVALAPLYCIGLVHASRRRLVASWALVASMASLVFAVRLLPQPARGFLDAGVVVGAAWGAAAILVIAGRAIGGRPPEVAVELPARGAADGA
ncbi:MAG TPA: hypothetical protein VD838_04035 [Anaeromyxobacteraceae bacterium]|nr:hypothetical protein [Anaeromyxobacteraceae bacterium]